MSDPYSVAGGAVGVISLGFMVGEKLVQFTRGIRHADEELHLLDSALQDFNPILNQLLGLLQGVDLGDCQKLIDTLLRKCLTGFIDISDRLATLKKLSSQGKGKRVLANVKYSLQSNNITQLVRELEAVKRDLQTAIQIPTL